MPPGSGLTGVQPARYEVQIPSETLADLKRRLTQTRWPNELPGLGWSYGMPGAYLRDLVAYWQDGFDWPAQEDRLNSVPSYRATLDGLDLHFLHARARDETALPLLLLHGYPSTPFAHLQLISRLVDDTSALSGESRQRFHVVAPSIPGHGLSQGPPAVGYEDRAVAVTFARLMTELGYERFGIYAFDIGASIAAYLCVDHPELVIGYHSTDPLSPAPYSDPRSPPESRSEQEFRAVRQQWRDSEGAYAQILGTKHQTLAYALNDSPAGLAAWIIEKHFAWTQPPTGDLEAHFNRDDLLTNVTLYWATESINAANRYYAEIPPTLGPDDRISVPTGIAVPPNVAAKRPPPEYVARRRTDIRRWTELPRGGHFVAVEEPSLIAADLRSFFGSLDW
jgi:pimeloyl-ACP methyl ester carboxylesterase